MRVTEKIFYNSSIDYLQKLSQRLNDLNIKVVTGKDINKPSDAPEKICKIIDLNTSIFNIEQYKENISEATAFLERSEEAIASMISIFNDAKRIAINGANAVYTIEQRKIMAQDIDNKLKELISLSNSQYYDKYIFAGYKTFNVPFTEVLDSNNNIIDVVYNGDEGLMPEFIDKDNFINKNIPGNKLKNNIYDIFKVLIDLKNNLNNDDVSGIINDIDQIDKIFNYLLVLRSDIGSKLKRLENAEIKLANIKNVFYKLQSKIEDIDMPDVISQFQLQQNIYQSAITTIGKIIQQTTLTDVLK